LVGKKAMRAALTKRAEWPIAERALAA
jgi:hypothetical protein